DLTEVWLSGQQWLSLFLLPWLVLLPLVGFFLNRYSSAPDAACRSYLILAAHMSLITLAHALVAAGVLLLVPHLAGNSFASGMHFSNTPRMMFEEGWLLFDIAIVTALAAAHYRRRLQQRVRAMNHNTDRLGRSLADSRLHALKMQLNP